MIAIARFNVPMSESASFRAEIELARDVLAQAQGFICAK